MGPVRFHAQASALSSGVAAPGTHAAGWPGGSGLGSCAQPRVWRAPDAASKKVQAGEAPLAALSRWWRG